ncbi:MAG TPA: hypothetical protein PLP19_21490 [bacterium]|nr:hypothetical protein [bacterium]HPN46072.1 hypothetical protein [bacterium]
MRGEIFHTLAAESIEEKARWFHSLSVVERLELLCAWTDVILAINPGILETKNAQPIAGRIQVLTKDRL